MDAFEQLVADLFWADGYWVRTGIKVELSREDKAWIGLPSCPRWEIDLVACKPATGELLALECKSYLDSGGVHAPHFDPEHRLAGRYKLFNKPVLRDVVLTRLAEQLARAGLCSADAKAQLGLVYGLAGTASEKALRARFEAERWLLFGPEWIERQLQIAAASGYENSMATIVAKLLLRGSAAQRVAAA